MSPPETRRAQICLVEVPTSQDSLGCVGMREVRVGEHSPLKSGLNQDGA
jgi:hypothetical protein